MPLIVLGIIAVGASLLLVYYSIRDRNARSVDEKPEYKESEDKDKGKVIYMFGDEEEGSSDDSAGKGDNKVDGDDITGDDKGSNGGGKDPDE